MYRALAIGPLGARVPFEEALDLAASHGFLGIQIGGGEIDALGAERIRALLRERELIAAATGLPVNLHGDEAQFDRDLTMLPVYAGSVASVGVTRIFTWIRPWHETLSYSEQWEQLTGRVRRVCALLARYGLRLGLEYVGTPNFRRDKPNPFIHSLDEFLRFRDAVGAQNLGVVLDSWHWYVAGESVDDLARLSDSSVVLVHVNDAPTGLSRDEQIDTVRALPGETGVIDLAGFMQSLLHIGYAGPVIVEPFSARLKGLAPADAVGLAAEGLERIWPR